MAASTSFPIEHGTTDIPPHYASGVGDSARSDIPSELWRGELGYLAAISPTVHRLALELIDRQARALAAVISDTTAVRPEIARLHGIALAGVFEIIISEAGRRTRDGQSQTKIARELSRIVDNLLEELDHWFSVSKSSRRLASRSRRQRAH